MIFYNMIKNTPVYLCNLFKNVGSILTFRAKPELLEREKAEKSLSQRRISTFSP